MKVQLSPRLIAVAGCLLASGQVLIAQACPSGVPALANATTCMQVFSAVDTRVSLSGTSTSSPNLFNTSTINLTCASPTPFAMLTGPLLNATNTAPLLSTPTQSQPASLQAGGNLIVDDNIFVTGSGNANTPTDVCPSQANGGFDGGDPGFIFHCFDQLYQTYQQTDPTYAPGLLGGHDPDTFIAPPGADPTMPVGETTVVDFAQGVGPIDISSSLTSSPAPQSLTIAVEDEGGVAVSSSIFLATNCTVGGVTGPATVSGNPFTTTDSTTLAQTFNFDNGQNQKVGFVYDVSHVNNGANGTIPQASDQPLAESVFQAQYVPGTSFATSTCLIHDGELLSDGVTHACKLFMLKCTDTTNGTSAGANCPVSVVENEVVKDLFDGPQFNLQNIVTPNATFHEGIGFLMASDDWSPTNGGPCLFDQNADPVANLPCPQNLLVSFSGPGAFSGQGLTTNPNSTFISIAGIPEDLTTVSVPSEWPFHWSNTHTPKVYFTTQAPNFTNGAKVLNSANKLVALPNASHYVPAPIKSITYGISAANNPTPPVPINEPIAGDVSLNSATPCPTTLPVTPTEPNFTPAPVTLSSLPDGQYLLHYYAQDCAGTQELQFTLNPPNAQNENLPYWSTGFYTRQLNIDTTPPVISAITLSPVAASYKMKSTVNASYSCSDLNTGAGVVLCGLNVYAPQTSYGTGTLKTKLDTSSIGTKTFIVYAADGAGNISSKSITYTVTH